MNFDHSILRKFYTADEVERIDPVVMEHNKEISGEKMLLKILYFWKVDGGRSCKISVDLIKYLLAQGVNPNAKDPDEHSNYVFATPLFLALQCKSEELVMSLIEAGADIDQVPQLQFDEPKSFREHLLQLDDDADAKEELKEGHKLRIADPDAFIKKVIKRADQIKAKRLESKETPSEPTQVHATAPEPTPPKAVSAEVLPATAGEHSQSAPADRETKSVAAPHPSKDAHLITMFSSILQGTNPTQQLSEQQLYNFFKTAFELGYKQGAGDLLKALTSSAEALTSSSASVYKH